MKKILCGFFISFFLISTLVTVYAEEEPDGVYEVYLQYTSMVTDKSGIEDVEKAINDISIPAINVKLNIVPVFIGNLAADTAYAIASNEKIDIVNVGLTNNISSMVSEGLLLPLDELLEERGQDILKVNADVADAQKINGVTYAISQYPYAASCVGFSYNKTMAEDYGIEMSDGMTLDDFASIGEVLKEQGVYLTSVGLSSELAYQFFYPMESFGEACDYGAILNPAENTEIIDLYDSEELRTFYKTVRKWYELGYLPENQMLDESEINNLYAQEKLFCLPTNIDPDQMRNISGSQDFEVGLVKTSNPIVTTSHADEFMLGIASSCQNPEAAMDFINLIYSDPDVANLLNYGVEGLDYVPVDGTENVITKEGTENADSSRYGSGFVRFGNPLSIKIMSPLTDDYYDELLEWKASADISKCFGYIFDSTDFSVQAINIAKILDEYLPILNVGLAPDVDAQIDAMVEELKTAGIDEIIAANNEKLQEYIQSKEQ